MHCTAYGPCVSWSRDLQVHLNYSDWARARSSVFQFKGGDSDRRQNKRVLKKAFAILLSEISNKTYLVKFDNFTQSLFMSIIKCVCTCISSSTSNRARCVLWEKLWSSFHQLRLNELAQEVNQTLFESLQSPTLQLHSQVQYVLQVDCQPFLLMRKALLICSWLWRSTNNNLHLL